MALDDSQINCHLNRGHDIIACQYMRLNLRLLQRADNPFGLLFQFVLEHQQPQIKLILFQLLLMELQLLLLHLPAAHGQHPIPHPHVLLQLPFEPGIHLHAQSAHDLRGAFSEDVGFGLVAD